MGLRKGAKPAPGPAVGALLDPKEYPPEWLAEMYQALSRSIYDSQRRCPWCNKEINISGPFCRECNRPAPRPICPRCHSPLYAGAKSCWGCKWKIDPATAMAAAIETVLRSKLVVHKAATGHR